jgi:hypothetical protein
MRSRPFLSVLVALGSAVGATFVAAVAAPAPPAEAASTTSAYVAMPVSQRIVDTRTSSPVPAGGTISVGITGAAPLPATGTVTAAVLNLTVTPPAAPGFWTVWPHGAARPEASNLNVDELQSLFGNVTPNLVTVPVGADGVVDIYGSGGGNVIVDLLGYYTPAATATAGRFESLPAPARVLDTRRRRHVPQLGETRTFKVPGAAGASAVAVNLTAVTNTPGFWQVYAQGSPAPATSNLNSPPGLSAAIANQAIVAVDATGSISIYSESGGDLIIDLVGSYTGAGAAPSSTGLFVPVSVSDTHRRHPPRRPEPARWNQATAGQEQLRGVGGEQPGRRSLRRVRRGAQRHHGRHALDRLSHRRHRRRHRPHEATDDVHDERRPALADAGEPCNRAGVVPWLHDVHRAGWASPGRPGGVFRRDAVGCAVRPTGHSPCADLFHAVRRRARRGRRSDRASARRGRRWRRCRLGSWRSDSGTPAPTAATA